MISTAQNVFGFIDSDHPLFPQISQFRESIRSSGPELLEGRPAETVETRALLRLNFSEVTPKLKWVYYCLQFRNHEVPTYRATTWLYRAGRNRTCIYRFPHDPKLEGPLGFFDEINPVRPKIRAGHELFDARVLRYVPRRRLTVQMPSLDPREGGEVVAKFVRRVEVDGTFETLQKVYRTTFERFTTPKPLNVAPRHGVFFQELKTAPELAQLLDRDTFPAILRECGRIHRDIHLRGRPNGKVWNPELFITAVEEDARLVSFFVPEAAQVIEPALRRWLAEVPEFGQQHFCLCHGDFRVPHLLCEPNSRWCVLDFDGAILADPHWEMASFITSLKRDLPMFENPHFLARAGREYLEGYQECGGLIVPERLEWFRFASEVHFLARTLQRDLLPPNAAKPNASGFLCALHEKEMAGVLI